MVVDSKKCKNCNNDILDNKNIFCSKSCSAVYNNKQRVKKDYGGCLECGEKLNKSKKYCSNSCQQKLERKQIFDEIEKGNISFHESAYKKYMVHKHGAKCMDCGWNQINTFTGNIPVQLEHKDGNPENNRISNLKLLCPNCHSLTKTWGGANRGNGRKTRKENRNKLKEEETK